MKLNTKSLFGLVAACLISLGTMAQIPVYYTNFTNDTTAWQLNGGSGTNSWIINDKYGQGGGIIPGICPTTPTSSDTAVQGNFLHIHDETGLLAIICPDAEGIPAYAAGTASDQAAISPIFSTQNTREHTLSFWVLCNGDATAKGSVEISIDGGRSYTLLQDDIQGIADWQQITIQEADSAWSRAEEVRLRFRWVNDQTGSDPPMCIDGLKVTAARRVTPQGIASLKDLGLKLYPMPAKDQITIAGNFEGAYELKVINTLGQVVCSQKGENISEYLHLDLQNFAAGQYKLLLSTSEGLSSQTVILEK